MMEQLETGNIGIGNTSTLATLNNDRFIIVDQKEIFWTGASLKDAGRLTFVAAKMGAEIIPGLLESIRKATSESVAYPADKSDASRRRHLRGGDDEVKCVYEKVKEGKS